MIGGGAWAPLLWLTCPLWVQGIRSTELFAEHQEADASFEWDQRHAGWIDVNCGGDMKVDRVPIPWETLHARVRNARSETECRACAQELMRRDILQLGWECRRGWLGGYSIYREADVDLGPKTPRHTFNLTEANLTGKPLPLQPATRPLPAALRGIFWLSDNKDSSALLTFAKNSGVDCKWCNTGKLIGNGYRIRVQGNCTWAFATHEGIWTSGYAYARNMRLIYDFIFDDAENPTYAHIGPDVRALPWNSGAWLKKQRWLLRFAMELETPEASAELGFPGSVMWRRRTYWFNLIGMFPYHMVQIVDEYGNRIEPAWSKFVEYQESTVAGDKSGLLYHHGCQ